MTRTDLAEKFGAAFAATPLADECVFLNPKHLDGNVDKEVCDLLLVLRKNALVAQMKCQEDPLSRSGEKLERWVTKQVEAALSQLQGAIRKVTESDFWCEHPRRGKVIFAKGTLKPEHGVVLIEHFDTRIRLESGFPLVYRDVPISYFTVNDFLNLINELRAFPEILSYLHARDNLPADVTQGVGGESVLFQHYILNDRSFSNWTTYEEVEGILASVQPQIRAAMESKKQADTPAYDVERLASGLASSIAIRALGMADPYLKIQEELLDLPLVERRKLGTQLIGVREKVRDSPAASCLSHAVVWFDHKPDFLYVCASSSGIKRDDLIKIGQNLLQSGLAFYGKTSGIVALESDNGNYLWFYATGYVPTTNDKALGERFFGSLKVGNSVETLLPPI